MEFFTLISNIIFISLMNKLLTLKTAKNLTFSLKNHKKSVKFVEVTTNVRLVSTRVVPLYFEMFLPFCRGEKVVQHIQNSL